MSGGMQEFSRRTVAEVMHSGWMKAHISGLNTVAKQIIKMVAWGEAERRGSLFQPS
jgi:hypothetical protein